MSGEKLSVQGTEFKDRVTHSWNHNLGHFILTLLKPTPQDAMWYKCEFESSGQHRKRISYVDLEYMKDETGKREKTDTFNEKLSIT